MEITFEELENSSSADEIVSQQVDNLYLDLFEELIPDDAMTLSVLHKPIEEGLDSPLYLAKVLNYLKAKEYEVIAYTTGLHTNHHIHHHHYNFILSRCKKPSNPSQHFNRWLDKNKDFADDLSFKWKKILPDRPKYDFLAYPLKEGQILTRLKGDPPSNYFNGQPMSLGMLTFLKEYAHSLYLVTLAHNKRQDLLAQRKQLKLNELYEVVKERNFTSYFDMLDWLEDNYLDNLELEELPDLNNYNSNCRKVAKKLRLIKFSQFCKNNF